MFRGSGFSGLGANGVLGLSFQEALIPTCESVKGLL